MFINMPKTGLAIALCLTGKSPLQKEEPHVPIFMKEEVRKTACLFIWLQYTLNVSRNPILYCRTLRHNIRTLYANEILSIHN